MRRIVIGIMGSGSNGPLDELAADLGERIAREGWVLLTGGRASGVMDAANRGAKRVHDSLTIGVLPGNWRTCDVSSSVDVAIFTNLGDARNAINVQSSDVIVAIGAESPGTLSEIALALKAGRPVILLGAPNDAQAFLKRSGGDLIQAARDLDDVIVRIRALLAH